MGFKYFYGSISLRKSQDIKKLFMHTYVFFWTELYSSGYIYESFQKWILDKGSLPSDPQYPELCNGDGSLDRRMKWHFFHSWHQNKDMNHSTMLGSGYARTHLKMKTRTNSIEKAKMSLEMPKAEDFRGLCMGAWYWKVLMKNEIVFSNI